MTKTTQPRFLAGFLLLLPVSAYGAGGHVVVDDTLVTPEREWLLEAWFTRESSRTDEQAAALSYGLMPGMEATLGFSRERVERDRTDSAELAGKWLLTDAEVDGIGIAVVTGLGFSVDDDRWQEAEAYIPVDVPVADGRFTFRYNLGWSHDRDSADRNVLTWGFGGDAEIVPAVHAIGEIYGNERDRTELQTGLRFLVADYALLDVGYGWERREPDRNWWTVGVAVVF
ncbi:MAG: hypothetical protein LAT50_12730 [Ectothiorhodospiraceae bacterium]|nr:hypothetical protein [Ectothiorhodospiraceae bacterium]